MRKVGLMLKRHGKLLVCAAASGYLAAAYPAFATDSIVSAGTDPCLPSAINLSVNSGVVGASSLSDLLSEFHRGGPELSAKIRKLALSDATKIRDILLAATTANPDQVTAIGAGLADVIRRCGNVMPELAEHIGAEVANAKSVGLSIAFIAHLPSQNLVDKSTEALFSERGTTTAPALPEKKVVKGEFWMAAPPPPPPVVKRTFMAGPDEIQKPSTAEIVARTKKLPAATAESWAGPYLTDGLTPGPKFRLGSFMLGKPGLTFSAGGGGGQTEIGNNTVSPTK